MNNFRLVFAIILVSGATALAAAIGMGGARLKTPATQGATSTALSPAPMTPRFYGFFVEYAEVIPYLDDLQKMGIQTFLARPFGGEDKTPTRESDTLILEAAKRGITCNLEIGNWVGGSRKDDQAARAQMDPQMARWRDLLNRVVKRYATNGTLWTENPGVSPLPVKTITIFDEPNGDYLTPFTGKTQAETYLLYLKAAHEIIKAWDPEIQIIGMNPSKGTTAYPGIYAWSNFIKDVDRLGGAQYCDIIGVHPYTGNNPLEKSGYKQALDFIKKECTLNGVEKPVAYTQIGYSLNKSAALPRGVALSEDMQANLTLRCFGLAAAHGVVQVDVMYYMDIPDFRAGFFEKQKVKGKWVWRKQATAVQTMISLLPNPVLVRTLSDGDHNNYVYAFNGKDGHETIMAWSTDSDPNDFEVEVKSDHLTLFAKDGTSKIVHPDARKIKIPLSPSPVFLRQE